jgi:hypothetical protein
MNCREWISKNGEGAMAAALWGVAAWAERGGARLDVLEKDKSKSDNNIPGWNRTHYVS